MNSLPVISEENINPAAIPKPVDDVQGDNRWWTQVIVLHVGTNNFGHTAEQIAGGLKEIIIAITKEKPSALLLVTTLLPRGLNPNPLRVRNAAVNVLLEDIVIELSKTNANVELIKIDQGFILPSGLISRKDFFDFLHLTNEGYKKAFENVHERAKSKLMDFCC
uniref:SGNH hydrolase-type esterase domain-containing protein n=1 Tax=Timema genevievae TaxID=629358 RepID=A0A7R9PI36_TIMGE|nr:unnamed protein product [Timema genevievae]